MRILVIGGMHGNELLGIQLVQLLRDRPVGGVDAMIANPRAVSANRRFIETDLNRSFGSSGNGYESRQARKIEHLSRQYDLVLDFHNTQTAENNCSFVGPNSEKSVIEASMLLDLSRCVIATYDCINKQCTNVLSIEISIGDEFDAAKYWYRQIQKMVAGQIRLNASRSLRMYKFVGRCTWQQREVIGSASLKPFRKLSIDLAQRLGYDCPVYPIFIGSKFTEYYATLLMEVKDKELFS